MRKQKNSISKYDLQQTKQKFDAWRKTKKHRADRIPKKLWEAAINLSKEYPVKIISETLGLNITDLKTNINIAI